MALSKSEQKKAVWKKPMVTTVSIEVPMMLTACTGFIGTCEGDGTTCCNSDGECFGGCVPL